MPHLEYIVMSEWAVCGSEPSPSLITVEWAVRPNWEAERLAQERKRKGKVKLLGVIHEEIMRW